MKNQPHRKTMTKTIMRRHKNKAVAGVNVKAVKTMKKKVKNEKKLIEKKAKKVKKLLKDKKAKNAIDIANGKVTGLKDKKVDKKPEKQLYEEVAPWSLFLDTNGVGEQEDMEENENDENMEEFAQENTISIKTEGNENDSSDTSIDDDELSDGIERDQEETEFITEKSATKTKGKLVKKKTAGDKKVKKVHVKVEGTATVVSKKVKKNIKKKKKAITMTDSGSMSKSAAKKRKKKSKMQERILREKQSKYETLKEKERELAIDLFGTDAGIVHTNREVDVISTLTETVVKSKVKKKRKISDSEKDQGIEDDEIYDTEPKRKAAWVDEDDESIRVKDVVANMVKARGTRGERETSTKKYESELREKFNQVYGGTPDWADLDNKPEEEEDDELVRRTGNYLSKEASSTLPRRVLEFKPMVDLNSSHTEGANIEAIDFNPNVQVGLVAGNFKHVGAVTLFQVDGKVNHRIHSARFPGYNLTCARFLRDGRRFVVGSNMNCHFYIYDMETAKETKILWKKKMDRVAKEHVYVSPDGELLVLLGHSGKICLYDTATLSLVDVLQAPHVVVSATFNADGSRMYTHGNTGEVCIWDMNARECIHKFYDDGCISGGIISMSPNNQYLACGSNSGVVNIYDSADLSSSTPKPVKALYNLKTKVTSLCFNSSSEVLAMASHRMPNALKLVHFPSITVFENFPIVGKTMKPVECLQFSPQSGYFAVGNRSGAAFLYRLKHFASY